MGVPMEGAGEESLPCPAWVYSNNSDVHIAKDLSWFGDDYEPFETYVTTMSGGTMGAIGIGTVHLPVQTSPSQNGSGSNGTLILKSVLHTPTFICNIIGNPILNDYVARLSGDGASNGAILARDGNSPVAFFKKDASLFEVKISEPPVGPQLGPSPFEPSGKYLIHAFWPRSERERLSAQKASAQRTPAENAWLKKYYGTEFKFLMIHGLSIYKEEDREEGRTIMRTFMANDDEPMT